MSTTNYIPPNTLLINTTNLTHSELYVSNSIFSGGTPIPDSLTSTIDTKKVDIFIDELLTVRYKIGLGGYTIENVNRMRCDLMRLIGDITQPVETPDKALTTIKRIQTIESDIKYWLDSFKDRLHNTSEDCIRAQAIEEACSFSSDSRSLQRKEITNFIQKLDATISNDTNGNIEIRVPMKAVILEHEDLEVEVGPMELHITPSKFPKLFVTGTKINNSSWIHPHVGGSGILCLGDAEAAITTAMARCDLYSIVEITESVLSCYNPDSPFVSIEQLLGLELCYSCGSREHADDDMIECEDCGEFLCNQCITSIDLVYAQSKFICDRCIDDYHQTVCCNEYVHLNDIQNCFDCNEIICSDCTTEHPDYTDEFLCDDCYQKLKEKEEEEEEDE